MLLIVGIALLLLGAVMGLEALSGRHEDLFWNQEEANLLPMSMFLAVGAVLLAVFAAGNLDPRLADKAPFLFGRKASMRPGEEEVEKDFTARHPPKA